MPANETPAPVDRARERGEELVDDARAETRSAARRGRELADETREATRATLRAAGRATIGAGDKAVGIARQLAPRDLPARLRHAPGTVSSVAHRMGESLRDSYDELSERGREVTGKAKRDPRVGRAKARTKAARSQAKGAATAVRREARNVGAQGERSVDTARQGAEAAGSQVKGAATSAGRAAKAQADAVGAVTDRLGAKDREHETGSGALEDRTVEQLRHRAAELGIEGRSGMKKQQLVEAIREAQ